MARTKRTGSTGTSTGGAAPRTGRQRQETHDSAALTLNERLRKHFRWLFALLAVIFALMFVVAGVGTSGPSMLDLIGQGGSDPAPTIPAQSAVMDAEAKTRAEPQSAQAWVDLAQAYIGAGQSTKAAQSAHTAAELAPKDAAIQASIADVYLAQAAAALQLAQKVYAEVQNTNDGGLSAVPQSIIPGQASGIDAFQAAREALTIAGFQQAMAKVTPLQTEATTAYNEAVKAQGAVTAITPDDPAAWFRLGQISGVANDNPGAIAAYAQFLKLAPNDPLVSQVKEEIDRLTKASAGVSTG